MITCEKLFYKNHNKTEFQSFDEEVKFDSIALKIIEAREILGFTQKDVAKKARVRQHQVENLESGVNCSITAFLRICDALGLFFELKSPETLKTI